MHFDFDESTNDDATYEEFVRHASRSPLYMMDNNGDVLACEDFECWVQWFINADKRVREDHVGAVCVSTAFLGFDHQSPLATFRPAAPPVLWATTIIGGFFDCVEARYDSLNAALQGHALAVRAVNKLKWIP